MAFTATTRTDYAKFLKELYKGSEAADLTFESNVLLALCPKNPNTGGTKYIKPINLNYIQGRGASYTTAYANVAASTKLRWELDWTNHYTIAGVDNKAIELAAGAGSAGSFRDLLVDSTDSAHAAFGFDLEVELHSDGTGKRGTVLGAISGLVLPLNPGEAVNFDVGMRLVHLNSAGTLLDAGEVQVVDAVDVDNDTITLDADWTTPSAAGHKLVMEGDQNAKAYGLEAWLPGSGVSATAFNSVDRSVYPQRLAGTDGIPGTATGLEITDCFVKTCASVARHAGRPNLILASNTDFATLAMETENRGRYAKVGATTGSVSFSALEIQTGAGAVPVVVDRHCPENKAFVLDTRAIELYSTNSLPSMFKRDGSFYNRIEGKDEISFYLYGFYGLCIQKPGTCSWIQTVV